MKNAWQSVFGLYFNGSPCRLRAGQQMSAKLPFIFLVILRRANPTRCDLNLCLAKGMHVHAWCDMTWQSLVTFCWCNNAAAASGNMPPYAAAAISLPAVRCGGGCTLAISAFRLRLRTGSGGSGKVRQHWQIARMPCPVWLAVESWTGHAPRNGAHSIAIVAGDKFDS